MKGTTTKYIARRFDSLHEYEKHLTNGTTQKAFTCPSSQREGEYEKQFRGTTTYEEANGLLMYGDRDLAASIEAGGVSQTRARIRANVQCIKTEASVVGFMPHVPNFVAGVPLSMIDARRTTRPSRSLSVVYVCSTNCGITTGEMIDAASKVLSAVMMIEASGTRVNLYSAGLITGHGAKIAAVVRVKSSDKKLDVVRCAYPLVNPSFFRRHFFRFVETTAGVPARYSNGYGHAPHDAKGELLDVAKHARLGIDNAVVLGFYDVQGKTADEIVNAIKRNGQ